MEAGKELKATMGVKAKTKKELAGPKAEMDTILHRLSSFIESANEEIATAKEMKDDAETKEVQEAKGKIEALARLAETHKTGYAASKKKWDALLS